MTDKFFNKKYMMVYIVSLLIVLTIPIRAEGELNLANAIEVGIKNNITLKNSRSNLEKSRYQFEEAKDTLKPDLQFSSSYTRLEDAPIHFDPSSPDFFSEDTKNKYSAGLTLSQPLYQSLFSGIDLAQKNVELAELQYKQSKEEIIYQIISTYYNVLKAQNKVAIQEESLKIAQEHERVAKARYDAGVVLKTDLLKSTIDKQNIQKQLYSSRNQLKTAKRNLAVLIGIDQDQSLVIGEEDYQPEISLDTAKLYNLAVDNSLDLKINSVNQKMTEYNKTINDSLYKPKLNLSGDYSTEGYSDLDLSDGSWSLTASITVDLYDGGVTADKKNQYDEELKQLQNSRDNFKEELKLNINTLLNTINELNETISIEELSLENARENLRIANKSYKAGTGTNLDVIDAQTSYRQSQINLSESRYEYKIQLFNILTKTGQIIDYYEGVIKNEQ